MTVIAIIGGSGPQGKGLGYRFARGRYNVILGSRSENRGLEAARKVAYLVGDTAQVRGAENSRAAQGADVVVLAIPYEGHDDLVAELAPQLADKIVVSCVNPLGFDRQGAYGLDTGAQSAAERAAELLPTSTVIGAFHHVSAASLLGEAEYLDHEDVLVCGDDAEAKGIVMTLAETVTSRPGIDAGRLRLARQLEPLTAVLISINRKYKVRSGISISGMDGLG